jgi:phosphatidylserine/phosphatidylglycerophosphate/cardiolipin synthase-like enzyme
LNARSARKPFEFVLAALVGAAIAFALASPECHCLNGSVAPVFSPNADSVVLPFVESAEHSIDAELYQFSNPHLKAALSDAVRRGVRVRLIMESRVESNYETAAFLQEKGVLVKWGSLDYTNTHSKYCVVDGKKVLVGSTNWSNRAMESNREASVIVSDPATAKSFLKAFEEDWVKGVAA